MPSFPDSVFAPANRSNGQTIDASHVNGVQDEIVAIEAGYINGTARLNSSNLNVTGASTFANRPVEPPPHIAVVYRETTQALGSSVNSTIVWNAQNIVTNSSMHSTTTNPERLTPQSTGVYQIVGSLVTLSPSSGSRDLQVFDSSVALVGRWRMSNSTVAGIQVICFKRFDVLGGYVTLSLDTDGSTHSVSAGLGNTFFSLQKL